MLVAPSGPGRESWLTKALQRSHAEMEGHDRSASPAWLSNDFAHNLSRSFGARRADPTEPSMNFYAHRDNSRTVSNGPSDRPSSPDPNINRPNTSGLHLPRPDNMASQAPRRFAGDGLDFRRPAGLARASATIDLSGEVDFIDLTADDSGYGASQDLDGLQDENEEIPQQSRGSRRTNNGAPRLPRGMDIIIDLDNGEEEWAPAAQEEPGSPDIQIVSSRRIAQPHVEDADGGDDVQFLRVNRIPDEEIQRRRDRSNSRAMELLGNLNGRFTHLRAHVERFNVQMNRTAAGINRLPGSVVIAPRRTGNAAPARRPDLRMAGHFHFAAPVLDFDMVGFDMGGAAPRAAEPAPPTYLPPLPAGEGFTRSPLETDLLICPNCEEELCTGDNDTKKQVWIVKSCGHVCHCLNSCFWVVANDL